MDNILEYSSKRVYSSKYSNGTDLVLPNGYFKLPIQFLHALVLRHLSKPIHLLQSVSTSF